MLWAENFLEFIFTIVIMISDFVICILLIAGASQVLKEITIGSGRYIMANNWTQAAVDAYTASCERVGKSFGSLAGVNSWLGCIVLVIPYGIAGIMSLVKIFKSQWGCASTRWILVMIFRIALNLSAIVETGSKFNNLIYFYLVHWSFWNKFGACSEAGGTGFYTKELGFFFKSELKTLLICFIFTLILGLVNAALECVVSILYRKNASLSAGSYK